MTYNTVMDLREISDTFMEKNSFEAFLWYLSLWQQNWWPQTER